jgi:hypothetical protein
MGVISRYIDIEFVYFIGYYLCLFLIALISFMIASLFTSKKSIGLLTALLAINFKGFTLGGVDILMPSFIQHTISIPFLFLALYLFFKNKERLAFFIIALTFYIHLLNALLFTFIISVYYLLKIKKIKEFILNYVILFILTIPVITNMLKSRGVGLFFNSADYLFFLKARLSHHIFPHTWLPHIIGFIVFLSFGIYCIKKLKIEEDYYKKLKGIFIGVLISFIISIIFTEFYPIPFIMRLYLFRTSIFLKILLIPFILIYLIKEIKNRKSWICFGILLSAASNQAYLFAAMILLFFIDRFILIKINKKWKFSFAFISKNIIRYFQGIFQLSLNILGIVIFIIFRKKIKLKHVFLLLTLIIVGVGLLNLNTHIKEGKFEYPHANFQTNEWNMFNWIKENTTKNSIFLVSPFLGFRSRALRPSFVEFKTAGQGVWDPTYGIEAWKRLELLDCIDKNNSPFNAVTKNYCESNYQNIDL